MKLTNNLYTTESVLKGHPDKMCDQISDLILDAYLVLDEDAHVAVECLGCSNKIILAGELQTRHDLNVEPRIIDYYHSIGYDDEISVINFIEKQSRQLYNAVERGGAGDQGIMYGYACNNPETNYLPLGCYYANMLAKSIDLYRDQTKNYLPDGKVQITADNKEIKNVLINVQHAEDCDLFALSESIYENAVRKVIPNISRDIVRINKDTGFISGGFRNDTGLTGRKIAVDTYGGLTPHGGGAFSGKDPTKVDRSAAYMARFVAKNIVANEYANECIVAVSYEFGEENPSMLTITTENPNICTAWANNFFDFRPAAIIERLGLRKTRYLPTSVYGHFTNPNYPWETVVKLV